mmetsp:Transcript_17100/g.37296  ORF Transcript_17100/g.37296 Transcript_17100/m.37296 type:complete len:187 (-) Transcript_17100:138-698(-)|eukprot:CAMPEP_0178502592 /NCGR_PEP_ID=MMETSP0696-20121128/17587_1 /TAXON_ID=265572 /ORGANISM="Extubocellulus spinifer, Strain CCMP396" /LENGTH=186 /DNA_ID=CAMNT_0020131661 /DNA_START=121 /DNA_END=681 /DNA_ORIENTATION=+
MFASRARAIQQITTTAYRRRHAGRALSSSGGGPATGFRKYLSNGTPEIIFGGGLLILLAADQLLQSKQEAQHKSDRQAVLKRLQYDVDSDTAQERTEGKSLSIEEESSKPCIFKCKVMTIPRFFDGTKSLMGVKVGDIVDVLEERVGPGGTYNLCRYVDVEGGKGESSDVISVGWYPMSCLEKIKS